MAKHFTNIFFCAAPEGYKPVCTIGGGSGFSNPEKTFGAMSEQLHDLSKEHYNGKELIIYGLVMIGGDYARCAGTVYMKSE